MKTTRTTTVKTTTVVNLSARTASCDVYVGSSSARFDGSIWSNPFKFGTDGTRSEVTAKYRQHLMSRPDLLERLPELRGKRLGCWCAPQACHADVLAEMADMSGNAEGRE
jgi:hypothetical protein